MAHSDTKDNLTQRVVTGLAGAAIIIGAVLVGQWSYFLVFLIITFFTLREFYNLAGVDGHFPQKAFGIICGLAIYVITFFIEMGSLPVTGYFMIFPLVSFVYLIKLYKRFERKPFTNIAFTFLGIFYAAVPFSLLHVATFESGHYNYEIVFGGLFILWISDTGAYFAGTRFGRRKLFERISPKKTWEGLIAGGVCGLIMSYVISRYFLSLGTSDWLIVGVIIIVGGAYGDLVESLLKRSLEIKDSSNALPGHGGFLDRFDGLLISVPFIVAYLELFRG